MSGAKPVSRDFTPPVTEFKRHTISSIGFKLNPVMTSFAHHKRRV